MNVAVCVAALYVTAPGTDVRPWLTVNVVVLIVAASISLLKDAVTVLLKATPVAAFSGFVRVTVGGAGRVVNVQT